MLVKYSRRSYGITLLLAAVVTLGVGIVNAVYAQETTYDASFSSNVKEAIPINVLVGQSRVINFDRPIGRFSISNPDIAEAVMVRPDQVLVNGKAFGQVNFIAWEKSDSKFIVFDVFVRANLSLIDSQIRALFPKDDIRLSQANGSVVLSGTVSDPATVAQADSVVQAAGFKTVNMLASPVKNATQIQLSIRVAEVSRNKLRELGSSFLYQGSPGAGGFISGGGPGSLSDATKGILTGTFATTTNVFLMGGNAAQMIRAMQTNGALRALAEPNLIAMDGQTASFLAGGEFPIPVPQAFGLVTIQFKKFGVGLVFTPNIMDRKHISLSVAPEVSELDFQNALRTQGFIVPAITTRRATTTIELADGQSFAIGGLLRDNVKETINKYPGLGDIPILGALFRSTSFQKNETELLIIVTAHLVKPLDMNAQSLPTDYYEEPNDFEFYLMGFAEKGGFGGKAGHKSPAAEVLSNRVTRSRAMEGQVGHIVP